MSFSRLIIPVFTFAAIALAQAPAKAPAPKLGPMPRLSNGKPDLSGVWDHPRVGDVFKSSNGMGCSSGTTGCKQTSSVTGDPPFTPAAKAMFAHHDADTEAFDPGVHCLPWGYIRSWGTPFPAEIISKPDRTVVLFEMNQTYKVIPTDGRGHDKNLVPLWMGDSVGHWEGDTLVIDHNNFNGKTWLDTAEHPSSDQLHIVERLTPIDINHISQEFTVEDPKVLTAPIKNTRVLSRMKPGDELLEYSCIENDKELSEHHSN